CAEIPCEMKRLPPMVIERGSKLRCSPWLCARREFLQAQLVLAFLYAIGLVGVEVAKGLLLSGEPSDFERIGPGCRAQTEIRAQVALGKIAAAAGDFADLG